MNSFKDTRSTKIHKRGVVSFSVGIILAITCSLWLPPIGGFLIVSDQLHRADAIFSLAGDMSRVRYAIELFKQGYAPLFAITNTSNPPPAEVYVTTIKRFLIQNGIPENKIVILPNNSRTTYEESLNLRQLAKERSWHSILVVTSPSHTRRARLILHEAFEGTGITISVVPVKDHWYTADSWWQSRQGWKETTLEYCKFVSHFLGYQ